MSERSGIHPTCPTCGSTAVDMLRRWAAIGMLSVRGWRVCQKCRHEFTLREGRRETIRLLNERQKVRR